MDFHSLTRRELQTLCKKNGIPANITNVAMADSLKALQNTVQGIEEFSNCSQSLTAQSGVESPDRSEVSSPCVPRSRSIRKKVGNESLVNQTQSRARRTTRNLNSGSAADEKDTIPPINIDVQFSEVQKQSRKISTSKDAGIPQTPSMISNTWKPVSKGETTAKTYGTRRSTRLAAKMQGDSSDAANIKLFSADGGDNLSEDFQSTVSHSEVVSETSKCEEMISDYSGVEIQSDLGSGCDSTKDCEKFVEMVISEEPEEENKGDDFHEQPEMQNNNEVIGENGDDFCKMPEVVMKGEVAAENGDVVTKQPETEIIAEVATESLDLNGGNDVLNNIGEVVTGEVMNSLTDNADILGETKDHDPENLVPEMNGLTLGDNGDMTVEAEEHVAGDALVVKEVMSESVEKKADVVKVDAEEQLNNGDCVCVEEFVSKTETEKVEADVSTLAADKQLDNGDCDSLGEESESEFESEFGSESEEEELFTKKQVDIGEDFGSESMDESETESEEADIVTKKQLDNGEESESESEEESDFDSESEEADLVTKKQLDNGEEAETETEEESNFESESEEEKAEEVTIVADEQLVKSTDCGNKASQEKSGEEDTTSKAQMITLDDGIVLPATVPPTGNNKSAATTKMIDNPNVLVGKENSNDYSSVVNDDNQQKKESNPKDFSLRQLKKELKKLSLDSNNKKANSVKLDEEPGTVPRHALKTLPENHQL